MFNEVENDLGVCEHFHYAKKYYGAAHSICNIRYKTPKEIPLVFQNGFSYDYNFIIKELTGEFNGQFERENTEKYITFSVPMQKENENGKTVAYKIKFIYSVRFMASSLLSLPNNHAEGIHRAKCEKGKSDFEYSMVRYKTLTFECIDCNKIMRNSLMRT